MYLLNTNVVAALRRRSPRGAVLAWLNSVADLQLHLSALTVAALQGGAERVKKTDTEKAAQLEAWIDLMPARFTILPMSDQTFRLWARLMHGAPQQLYGAG